MGADANHPAISLDGNGAAAGYAMAPGAYGTFANGLKFDGTGIRGLGCAWVAAFCAVTDEIKLFNCPMLTP